MELRKNLLKQCQVIIETPIDQLTQINKYGQAGGFESIRPLFEKTILVFQKLASSNFDFATEKRLRSLSNSANAVLNQFNSFRNFNIDQVPLLERTQRMQN